MADHSWEMAGIGQFSNCYIENIDKIRLLRINASNLIFLRSKTTLKS